MAIQQAGKTERETEMSGIEYNGTITFSMAVKDRLKTAEWFQKHLGFKTAFDVAEIGWLEMETSVPGVTLGFGENMEAKPGNSVPVFGVKDIDATRAKLEGAGVKFDGDTIVY